MAEPAPRQLSNDEKLTRRLGPLHWLVSRPALQPQLRELRHILFDDRVRRRAARAQALADHLQPALAMIHDDIDAAERDYVAFPHLRPAARDLPEFAQCVAQGVLVLLAAVYRPQRLGDQDVEEVLPALGRRFREAEHHFLTPVELLSLLSQRFPFGERQGRLT